MSALTSPRKTGWVGITGLFLAVLTITLLPPSRVDARPAASAGEQRATDQRWEEILLLAAIRSLELTPAQTEQALKWATETQKELSQLQEAERRETGKILALIDRTWHDLLREEGRASALQAEVQRRWRSLQASRTQTEQRLTDTNARRLAKTLSKRQILLAYYLAIGTDASDRTLAPALLEPDAGFRIGGSTPYERVDLLTERLLDRRLSARIRTALKYTQISSNSLDPADLSPEHLHIHYRGGFDDAPGTSITLGRSRIVFGDEWGQIPEDAPVLSSHERPLLMQAARDKGRLITLLRKLPQRIDPSLTTQELADILWPVARRLFLSPRAVFVLEQVTKSKQQKE